jgi:signal-transduction protein with cAMP-binding, CBS, and nucleotidyltransferase domain
MKTAVDVMTKHVVDIQPEATVGDAIEKMREWNVSSLLVRRQDSTDTWGFMSRKDVLEKVVARGLDSDTVHVYEIMTKPVITVPPNCSLRDCAALMVRADIRRVLVFDGQDIVGIVSSSDIFNVT